MQNLNLPVLDGCGVVAAIAGAAAAAVWVAVGALLELLVGSGCVDC